MGRPEEALAAYEEARPIIDRVLREVNPSESRWQGFRAWNAELIGNFHRRRDAGRLASRGLALARSGHPAEAVTAYRQAIKVLEGLEPTQVMASVRPAIKPTLDHYHLACDHARLAQLAGAADSGLSAAEGPAERDRAHGVPAGRRRGRLPRPRPHPDRHRPRPAPRATRLPAPDDGPGLPGRSICLLSRHPVKVTESKRRQESENDARTTGHPLTGPWRGEMMNSER